MLHCLLINLEYAEERRIFSIKNLSKLNLDVTLINAVPASSTKNLTFSISDSAKACFESHSKSWHYIRSEQLNCALVCEDDFYPARRLLNLDSILESFNNIDWDVIQIGFLSIGINAKIEIWLKNTQSSMFWVLGRFVEKFSKNSSILHRKRIRDALFAPRGFVFGDFQSGSHAYLVSSNGARKLSELPTNLMPVDAMLHILSECNSLSSFRSRKSYVSQFAFPSQISERNH
jgi:GR25 family glycosyltransferase involved in LPS biosynthesis